ncbi:fungal protein [Schizosaccharomyces japonicus yFS275]|uniref:25S rRNA adenine-N(1) methyltransferase n=1 Tax=Schizosaccharomyces japonicus (strain yFS275 / FY16936) TaxID=402676 RepID=B6K335_SCHJY|nr:fungal protein [Schizosaccharomyces japonicus yFS275]EEB07892.1 fungal protein [Schizosaccharomyces japonicus yFS275]
MRPVPVRLRTERQEKPGALKKLKGNKLIRHYHVLLKRKEQLKQRKANPKEIQKVQSELDMLGIDAYQKASQNGQNKRRGGDSSVILVEYVKSQKYPKTVYPIDLLEIGCVSIDNKCSTSKLFRVDRIDLHSTHPLIKQQDILERTPSEGMYGCISCSLVLNFAPPETRGDILLHCTRLLKPPTEQMKSLFFLVLPAPCVLNSRYMSLETISKMMEDLGLFTVYTKTTAKIVYLIYEYRKEPKSVIVWKKKELFKGATRNNFFIPLNTTEATRRPVNKDEQ